MAAKSTKRVTFIVPVILDKNVEHFARFTGRWKMEIATEAFVNFLKAQGIAEPLKPIPAPWDKEKEGGSS